MPRLPEYCITCGVKMHLVGSYTIEFMNDLYKLDLKTMKATLYLDKYNESISGVSYEVVCPRCHDNQPVTVEVLYPTTGE